MMMYDGAPDTGSVKLRLYERPGKKYFAKDLAGKRRTSIPGVWVSYRYNVYNVSDRTEEHRKVFKVGKYRNAKQCRVAEIFISNEMLSYLSLSGSYIVEGLEIENIIPARDTAVVELTLDDIVADKPRVIKSIGMWNDRERKAENFRITGRYIKPKTESVDAQK